MAEKKKIILVFDAETGKVTQQVGDVKKAVDATKESVDDVGGSFSSLEGSVGGFGGKAISAFKGGVKGAKSMIMSMKTLRGAVISTGIGAIVIAVVAMIQAVSRLQGVQDKYKAATAGLSAIFDVLMDTVAFLGEHLISLFEDPQKALSDFGDMIKDNITNRMEGLMNLIPKLGEAIGLLFSGEFSKAGQVALDATGMAFLGVENLTEAIEQGAEALGDYVDKLIDVGVQATKIAMLEQRLEDIMISQISTQAMRRKQIAEEKLLAQDLTLTYEEREAALQKALDLEAKNLEEQLTNARTEFSLLKQKNALSESGREDKRAEAEALAKIYQLEEASLNQQKEVFTQLQGFRAQAAAARQKQLDDEQAYIDERNAILDEQAKALAEVGASQEEKELMALEEKYNKMLDLAMKYNLDTAELEEARGIEAATIMQKFRDKESTEEAAANKIKITQAQALKKARIELAGQAIEGIAALADAFNAKNEQQAKKQFQVSKALGIAQAGINTAGAVADALAKDSVAPLSRYISAAAAGAMGLAQIAKIKQTQFNGGGSSSSVAISTPSVAQESAAATAAPQIDFGFLQNGANQQSIQAYVLSSNVSNSAQANQLIKDQSAL